MLLHSKSNIRFETTHFEITEYLSIYYSLFLDECDHSFSRSLYGSMMLIL